MRGVEQNDGARGSAQQAGYAQGDGDAKILANVVAVGGDGGKLARPQGDGVGGVGLNGQHLHAEHGGEQQKRASPGHGVEHTGDEGRHSEPEPMPVHERGKAREMNHVFLIVEGASGRLAGHRLPKMGGDSA